MSAPRGATDWRSEYGVEHSLNVSGTVGIVLMVKDCARLSQVYFKKYFVVRATANTITNRGHSLELYWKYQRLSQRNEKHN